MLKDHDAAWLTSYFIKSQGRYTKIRMFGLKVDEDRRLSELLQNLWVDNSWLSGTTSIARR